MNSPTDRCDRDLYLACLLGWADMYVKGYWTLAQFEEHADAMMGTLEKDAA